MFSIEIPLISLKNQKRDRMITHAMREGIEQNLLIDNKFYYVSYNIERRQKCQIILDKTKL